MAPAGATARARAGTRAGVGARAGAGAAVRFLAVTFACGLLASASFAVRAESRDDDSYLTWPHDRAETVARSTRSRDSAGQSWWDTRGTRTERSMRYKVVATWMTPEVVRATARVLQLRTSLSADAAKALVAEADSPKETTVMIDIDPHEGSGVIPLDWQAWLGPYAGGKGIDGAVAGTASPKLRDVRALNGIDRRDYAYDRFWMVFPLATTEGRPLFGPSATEAELIVRIYDKEARVKWTIPASLRAASTGN